VYNSRPSLKNVLSNYLKMEMVLEGSHKCLWEEFQAVRPDDHFFIMYNSKSDFSAFSIWWATGRIFGLPKILPWCDLWLYRNLYFKSLSLSFVSFYFYFFKFFIVNLGLTNYVNNFVSLCACLIVLLSLYLACGTTTLRLVSEWSMILFCLNSSAVKFSIILKWNVSICLCHLWQHCELFVFIIKLGFCRVCVCVCIKRVYMSSNLTWRCIVFHLCIAVS